MKSYVPLGTRDFFGGRMDNVKTCDCIKPSKSEKYVNICSLYIWEYKYAKFPITHPKVLVGEGKKINLQVTNGLIKCKILPPQELYYPV